MSKITYETLRHDLDKILEMAQPIIEHAKLIDELHKRICFWEQDMKHWFLNEPELEYCRDRDCEDCHRDGCPEMRQKATSLRWGSNSLNDIAKLIGTWDMYACGRKEYKCGE